MDETINKKYCSFTVMMQRKDREAFKLAVLSKGKSIREVLPNIINQWVKNNTKDKK